MDKNTKELLLSAWGENRLAAVHVDLQNLYIDGNEAVFRSVGNFAAGLTTYGITNTWVTYPKIQDDNTSHVPEGLTTVQDFNRMAFHPDLGTESLISPLAQARLFEKTVVKHWGSAFNEGRESVLYQHLNRQGVDTVLIDGVSFDACMSGTLRDGTNLDQFDFLVVEDCINIPQGIDYKRSILTNPPLYGQINMEALERRFHSACSTSVLEALKQSTRQDAAEPTCHRHKTRRARRHHHVLHGPVRP